MVDAFLVSYRRFRAASRTVWITGAVVVVASIFSSALGMRVPPAMTMVLTILFVIGGYLLHARAARDLNLHAIQSTSPPVQAHSDGDHE